MALKRLTDRTLITGVTLDDLIHIVDVEVTTENPAGSSFKATVNQLKSAISGRFGVADSNGVYTYYSTLQSAITAAAAGQTVEMFTDYDETTSTTVNLKDGVDINFNGHTYLMSVAANTNVFRDNGVAVNCRLYNGTIKKINSPAGVSTTTNLCLYLTADSTIETDCTFIGELNVITSTNTSSNIIGGKYYSTVKAAVSTVGLLRIAGNLSNAYVESLSTGNTYGITVLSTGKIENCIVYSTVNSSNNNGVLLSGIMNECYVDVPGICVGSSSALEINGCVLKNSSQVTSSIGPVGLIRDTTVIVSSTNSAILINSGNQFKIVNCDIYNLVGAGISIAVSGTTISNTTIYSDNQSISTNGDTIIDNCTLFSLTSNALQINASLVNTPVNVIKSKLTSLATDTISHSDIDVDLTVSNCVVECLWDNSAGNPISLVASSSGHSIVNNHLIVTNASAFAILGSSTGAKLANNIYDGGAASGISGVSQEITNTQSTQGNILIN